MLEQRAKTLVFIAICCAIIASAIYARMYASTDQAAASTLSAANAGPLNCQSSALDPNPIATSSDSNIIAKLFFLNQEAVRQPISELSSLDTGTLHNKWFKLEADDGKPYLLGAKCDELIFRWTDRRFAFTSAFVALERVRRWLSLAGLQDAMPPELTVRLSETQPTSRYDASTRELVIGSRQCEEEVCACGKATTPCPVSVDDRPIWPHAQDGDVVAHEYGHAVLHHIVCGDKESCLIPTGGNVFSLDEAFSDYLASAVNGSQSGQQNDPFCFGEWYNSFELRTGPCLRRLDSPLHWPEAARALRDKQLYGYATIWASTLYKARFRIDPAMMDGIVFDAYAGMHQDMTFEEMAARLMQSTGSLGNDGDLAVMRAALRDQGFLSEIAPSPEAATAGQFRTLTAELDSWQLSAFPTFDHTKSFTVTGASAIQLHFQWVRLKPGNCIDAICGRIYISAADGTLHQIMRQSDENFTSVIIPGPTAIVRFVASSDHPRTLIYRLNGVTEYKLGD